MPGTGHTNLRIPTPTHPQVRQPDAKHNCHQRMLLQLSCGWTIRLLGSQWWCFKAIYKDCEFTFRNYVKSVSIKFIGPAGQICYRSDLPHFQPDRNVRCCFQYYVYSESDRCCKMANIRSGFNFAMFAVADFSAKLKPPRSFYKTSVYSL